MQKELEKTKPLICKVGLVIGPMSPISDEEYTKKHEKTITSEMLSKKESRHTSLVKSIVIPQK